jgi:beta-N-acetylhexosaminidase
MTARAFITGLAGTTLTPAERSFLREAEPWGLIVFKRNIETPAQLLHLTASFREAVGRNAPVLVDQEGGRVQRLEPPHWPAYPPGAAYGCIYDRDAAMGMRAAHLGARLIAADLRAVGIDVDCLPIADVPVPGAHSIISDRAYGDRADKVAALARTVAEGLLAEGVLPVLKHIPGHGRATVDSHGALPIVETDRATLMSTDFAAFRPLFDLPLGMTAHVVYAAIDPLAPATTSVTLVRDVIRNWLGFRGLLMSDDISMGALSGSLDERSRAAIAAGCDVVLHCSGKLDEMEAVAAAVPMLGGEAAARGDAALGRRRSPGAHDLSALRMEWAALMNAPADAAAGARSAIA